MKYNFDAVYSRKGIGASKWDAMIDIYGAVPDDIVPLSVADMEFRSPPELVNEMKRIADIGMWGYSKPTDEYREAVMDWMRRRHDWDVRPEWIVNTPGVVAALYVAVRAYTDEGDNVIIQTPVYYPFSMAIKANNRNILENPLKLIDGRYEMDFDDLREKAKKAKMLILCSPHNPVGRVWTEKELRTLGEICNENNVLVVSDEIHFDLVFKPNVQTVYMKLGKEFADNCVIATAASKTFSLAGMGISNIIIPDKALRERFTARQMADSVRISGTAFGLPATQFAYTYCEDWFEQLMVYLKDNYDFLTAFMKEHFPRVKVFDLEGTYLVWADFSSFQMDEKELEKFMVHDARLILDEGYIFGTGGAGFERFNIACPRKVLENALNRLYAAAKKRGLA